MQTLSSMPPGHIRCEDQRMDMLIASPGPAPESGLWLTSAHLVDGRMVDVLLAGGIVTEVVAAGASDGLPGRRLDLGGYLLLGAPAEPHTHLDKTGTFDDVACGSGELNGAREAWQRWSAGRDRADIVRRAEDTLSALVAHGATAVRTHVALHPDEKVPIALEALTELRERWRDRVNLQVVPMLSPDTPDELAETAVKAGADRLGGAPYCSPDPEAAVGRLVGLAQEYEIGLDIHTDETLDPGMLTLVTLADLVIARDFLIRSRRATASAWGRYLRTVWAPSWTRWRRRASVSSHSPDQPLSSGARPDPGSARTHRGSTAPRGGRRGRRRRRQRRGSVQPHGPGRPAGDRVTAGHRGPSDRRARLLGGQ